MRLYPHLFGGHRRFDCPHVDATGQLERGDDLRSNAALEHAQGAVLAVAGTADDFQVQIAVGQKLEDRRKKIARNKRKGDGEARDLFLKKRKKTV